MRSSYKWKMLEGHWTIKLGTRTAGRNQKLPKFGFHIHTTALWSMEQSSILFAKFDCPVARQNFSLFN